MKLQAAFLSLLSLLACNSALAAEPTASGPEEPSNRWSRPAVEALVGWDGPVGELGLGLDVPIAPVFAFTGALGFGLEGFGFGGGLRLRAPVPAQWAVTPSVGLGFSRRPHYYSDAGRLASDEYSGSKRWSSAVLFNADLGVDIRASFGLSFRVFAGEHKVLNPDDFVCRDGYTGAPSCEGDKGARFSPYGGMAIGYAFAP